MAKEPTEKKDWHPADISAAVRKTGTTLADLARSNGYHESACSVALLKPWPAVQRIIAARIGKKPEHIWPSRYDRSGSPIRRLQSSTHRFPTHVQTGVGV